MKKGCLIALAVVGGLVVIIVIALALGGKAPQKSASETAIAPAGTPSPKATAAPTEAPSTETPPPKATAAPTEAPSMAGIGDRVESAGIALTVVSVTKADQISTFLKPSSPEKEYLVIEVIIENTSRDQPAPYNPLYFKVKDADAYEYNTAILAPDPALQSGELAKGAKVRGKVAFEVPKTATGFVVSYQPLVILGGYETIYVDLSQ